MKYFITNKKIKDFLLFIILTLSSYFLIQDYGFSSSGKTFSRIKQNQRQVDSDRTSSKGKADFQNSSLKELWEKTLVFKNRDPILYYLKKNPDIIVSVATRLAIPLNEISSPKDFFNESEREKKALFHNLPIGDRKLSFSMAKKKNGHFILYSRGSYIDFKDRKVLFEDWNFYHKKVTLHFLVHARDLLSEWEREAVTALFKELVLSNGELLNSDKTHFLDIFEKAKKNES